MEATETVTSHFAGTTSLKIFFGRGLVTASVVVGSTGVVLVGLSPEVVSSSDAVVISLTVVAVTASVVNT